jgi:phosphoglycerate dehydrogenase-like enzyme
VSRLTLVVLDDREGLINRSPGAARMRELADVRVLDGSLDQLSDAELAEVQVLMPVRERTSLDAATLARMPALELVLQTGGHAYHLDTGYAAAHGIPVALGRRAYGPKAAIPELTFALAIDALRMIPQADRSMRNGEWKPFLGRTLSGRTLGILGYGRHGRNVARIAKAFGMTVRAWQRTPGQEATDDVERLPLDELLAHSDVLSIHLKLTDESRGLLDAEKLSRMKPGSVLVNTARGAIVDEEALIAALQNGPMSAAALDVFAHEPLAEDSPLRSLPNVVLTPHVGWTVEEVLTEFADIAADQLGHYLDNRLDRRELHDASVALASTAHGGLADENS